VIATGILTLAGAVFAYFLNWWPSIKNFFSHLASFLVSVTEVSNWLIGLMAICTSIIVIVIAGILWSFIFPEKQNNNWHNYISDNFFGLEWHWKYGDGGSIYNLYSCCIHCRYQVHPQNASAFRAVPSISFQCDSCGSTTGPFEGSQLDLESKVERFIQQKLRTGSWLSNESA